MPASLSNFAEKAMQSHRINNIFFLRKEKIYDNDFVIITREEYNKLIKTQTDINESETESKNTNQQ